MGKTISIWAVCLTVVLAGFSYTNTSADSPGERGDNEITIVDNDNLSIYVESEKDFKFFLKAEFDETEEEIKFLTREYTTQIRVYNEIESMVYLLPIGSDRVRIGKSLFERGEYKFVFDIEGDRRMFTSKVEVY